MTLVEARTEVCDSSCNEACVGPGNTECISLCPPTPAVCSEKCEHFEFEDKCINDCSGNGLYSNGTLCTRCDDQCDGSCSGPVSYIMFKTYSSSIICFNAKDRHCHL